MKKYVIAVIAILAVFCAGCANPPTAQQQQQIQVACGVDAGLRPTVTMLEPLMTPQEIGAVVVFRATVDQVCAAPIGSQPTATEIGAMTAAVNSLGQVVANANARKNGAPVPFPNIALPAVPVTPTAICRTTGADGIDYCQGTPLKP